MKTHLFFISAFAAAAAASTTARAQSLEPFNPYGIYSPSVEAWQMTRHGNLTPSLYTGAMTFSLPLYTYSDLDFTIPVSLEYSFDGYRPEKHSGTIGYGWYLNCGGVITREVRGLPDDGVAAEIMSYPLPIRGWKKACSDNVSKPYYLPGIWSAYRLSGDSTSSSDYVSGFASYSIFHDTPAYAEGSALNGLYDMQADMWHFSFLGHSGDFMILEDGRAHVFNSDLPEGQISIDFDMFGDDFIIQGISIDTGDGYVYSFEEGGRNRVYNDAMAYDPPETVTSWRLASITAPNGRKAVFEYAVNNLSSSVARYSPEVNGVYNNSSIDNAGTEYYGQITSSQELKYAFIQEWESNISAIRIHSAAGNGENAMILFNYSPASNDEFDESNYINPDAYLWGSAGAQQLLKHIKVLNNSGETVEKVEMTHICAASGTPKSFLSTVSTLKGGTWLFDYKLDGYCFPENDTQATDHWGFWNGSTIRDLTDHLRRPGTRLVQEGYNVYGPGPDSVLIATVPPVYEEISVNHLYDQMADSSKEAVMHYAVCGALSRITYPTGGCTAIEYEGNRVARRMNAYASSDNLQLEYVDPSNHARTYNVGGVRVAKLTDLDGNGGCHVRSFTYETLQGEPSGLLMRMPKYVDDALYSHYAANANGTLSCHALISSRAYCNTGAIQQPRDGHIAYPSVREIHPDGSYTCYGFSCWTDPGYADIRTELNTAQKHVISAMDWIEPYSTPAAGQSFITVDRCALRGRPVYERTFTAQGTEVRNTNMSYTSNLLSINEICHNGKYYYYHGGFSVAYPRQTSRTETLHGMAARTEYNYNSKGQISRQLDIYGSGTAADSSAIYRRHLWKEDSTFFASAISFAARTRIRSGQEYVIAAQRYEYDDYIVNGNTKPTAIYDYSFINPAKLILPGNTACVKRALLSGTGRKSTYTYDGSFRLTAAALPGGASLEYSWDRNNPVSRTENGASVTTYMWKDMVGPVSVTSPSGISTGYGYDAGGRLGIISDSRGCTLRKYDYHQKND